MLKEDRKLLIRIMEEDGIVLDDKGNYYVCKCPFHDDSTASMVIYKNNYKFTCFGCNEKGDVVDYLRKARNMSFGQAIKYLNVEHKSKKFINKRLSMIDVIAKEDECGINVEEKYGKDFIDSLLVKRLVDTSKGGEAVKDETED